MRHRYIKAKLLLILTTFWLSSLTECAAALEQKSRGLAVKTSKVDLPRAHLIVVPQHKQINGLGCGPASIEIVFDYWGVDIDQKAIADVARTSSIGTWTWDIARTGHFSHLSNAQGKFFPHDAPNFGFSKRPEGYASFSYSSDTFWWTELKSLIASDIPVILLMKYAPDDPTGHYRVIVGYDENEGVVYFMDPWDRDLGKVTNTDGTITWYMDDFVKSWNYKGYGAPHPYWGAVMLPWSIKLYVTGRMDAGSVIKVTAIITYPCPEPFDRSTYPASDVYAKICLPAGMSVKGSNQVKIGTLLGGKSVTVSWNVQLKTKAVNSIITVLARGIVSGNVPEANWKGNGVSYPPYSYTDEIGGEASILL